MVVLCLLVWSSVSLVLGLLVARCIAVGQGRDAQRQGAWSPDPALAGLFAPPHGGGCSEARELALPVLPAPRQPVVPVAERV